ncbi:MAG: acyltransferase [Nitrospirae bacterium]|nr:acyltransferase [Nitrospirota bacterium]
MKAGLYQFNPAFGEKEKNLGKVASAAKDADIELLVLPELFATGYQFTSKDEVAELSESIPNGRTTEFLCGMSKEKGIYIAAGLAERGRDEFYNSAVVTGPEGFIGAYRKTHVYSEENLYFSPGDSGFRVWDTKIGRIGVMICFDWFFPESLRSLALSGADVVAHPSNLVLPYCPAAMPTRALENGVFTITANRTGIEERKQGASLKFIGSSLIVSPRGKVLAKASADGEELITADIDISAARDKSLNIYNDILGDRRPDRYGAIFGKE